MQQRVMMKPLSLLYVGLLFLGGSTGLSEDWPQFHGVNRDGKSPEMGLMKQWPAEGLKPLWVVEGLGTGYSSVAVARGRIYTTGMGGEENQGVLLAFDLAGNPKWQTPYGPEWNEKEPGTRSTPTVEGDSIYLMSGIGHVFSFDAKTGAKKWAVDTPKKFGGTAPMCGFAESVLIVDEKVICTPGGKDATLVALDKTNGQTIWTSKGFSEQSAYCTPILVERGKRRLIVTMTEKSVVSLDPKTGELLWKFPQDPTAKDPNHSISPVYQDGCIYATSGHGQGGQMLTLSPDGESVTQKWVDKKLNCVHGGVIVVDRYLYGATSGGIWVCLDFNGGKLAYQARGVGRGSVAYADGMLYCYGENGTIGLVQASAKGHELISSFKVTQGRGRLWAHPAISDGRLYIRHGNALMSYDIKEKPIERAVPNGTGRRG